MQICSLAHGFFCVISFVALDNLEFALIKCQPSLLQGICFNLRKIKGTPEDAAPACTPHIFTILLPIQALTLSYLPVLR